jgi:hypothetical protein
MATSPLKVKPSKDEVWTRNFVAIKKFYEENGHLTLPTKAWPEYNKLSQWLTYQRHYATTLTKKQLQLLKSIHYTNVRVFRESNEKEWQRQFERLEHLYHETGRVIVPVEQRDLARWVTNQKKYMRIDLLDTVKKQRLLKLGIRPKLQCQVKQQNPKNVEKWQSQFGKLKEYRKIHGDCNVPRNWKEDHSLRNWVMRQRSRHKQMETGESVMDKEQIEALEKLGFEWRILRDKRRLEI